MAGVYFSKVLLVSLLFGPFTLAADADGSALPKDVQQIIERKASCGHWSGEDGYDEERKKEIAAALSASRCADFDRDMKAIQKKYHSRKSILKAISQASSDG